MTSVKKAPLRIDSDPTLRWVGLLHPQLNDWRDYAVRWIADSSANQREKLMHLRVFFEEYLVRLNLPVEVSTYLKSGSVWPDFSDSILHVQLGRRRIICNDQIADFLAWIIKTEFSAFDASGDISPLPGFHNPVKRVQKLADRNIRDKSLRPHNDKKLRWVTQLYPELAAWRQLGVEWMAGEAGSTKPRLLALQCFFREFIIGLKLPVKPEDFFRNGVEIPDFYDTCMERRSKFFARPWTTHIHSFSAWVLTTHLSVVDESGKRVIAAEFRNPINSRTAKQKAKTHDLKLMWVVNGRPDLEEWRRYAEDWLAQEAGGIDSRLKALVAFFERYIIGQNLPSSPAFLLARKSLVPDFFETCCVIAANGKKKKEESHSVNNNNRVSNFLDWVLIKHFSIEDDNGCTVVSPVFRNPVPHRSYSGGWVNRESVHTPLPFSFIEDMRLMLAQGPTFGDWTWAQNALGVEVGLQGQDGADWYAVNEEDIDKNDPECVWRLRTYEAGHVEYQMWSPVRWVALLMKLQIPLRMLQVRMLDSGEADTWRYANGVWSENKHKLAEGSQKTPLAQGFFRQVGHLRGVTVPVIMYANTNKTADQRKSGPAKGYEIPWPCNGPIHQNPYYWAERLRNWQEKYNPITRRTSWSELGSTHIPLKTEEQLATYPDACFLFRMREVSMAE